VSGGRTTSGEPGVWQIWVDTGGTFTDALGVDPLGRMLRAKILSTSALRGAIVARLSPTRLNVRTDWSLPDDFIRGFRFRALGRETPGPVVTRYDSHTSQIDLSEAAPPDLPPGAPFEVLSPEEAPLLAARILTGTPPDRPLPPLAMRLATTLGTNALLTRKGAPTALFITEGFGDLLRIGTQQRPDLFALDIRRPEPLYAEVVEVRGRLAADGSVLRPLDERAADDAAARLAGQGIGSAAVALLHSHRNPEHEHILKRILERRGMRHVSCSSQLAPFMRLLPRAETAVVNAYLAPILEAYLARVCGGPGAAAGGSGAAAGRAGGGAGRLHVMTSAGGLVAVEAVRPKDMLLSGPAGGVVGAAAAGRRAGFDRVIAFDMGGTSTDVARVDGDFEYSFEHEVGDARLLAPALAIESVAAGGGSVCWFDGHRLRVGPQSAGASPGPACYGAGGPLTLTDVNLLLGRLDARRFEIPIFADEAGRALDALARAHRERTGERTDDEALLAGLLDIANERMADAIRSVSLRRGYDPAAYALLAFGGAGGQHACRVADLLGIPAVLVPPDAGLLSAFGLGRAVFERFAEEQVLEPLERSEAGLPARFERLERRAIDAVRAEGVPGDTIAVRRRVAHVRLAGQDSAVEVPWDPPRPLRPLFEERYAALFGHRPEGRAVELESIRVVASSRAADGGARGGTGDGGRANLEGGAPGGTAPETTTRAHFEDAWIETRAFDRARLQPGARCDGPALIFEAHSATVVEPGWGAEIDPAGTIVLRREAAGRSALATEERSGREATAAPEAVRLELFTNRFRAIAAEMGERLRRTAISTNIKERLDFSCALLDARGELVVNAPHIPVHLGGIGLCVQRLRDALPMRPGDVVVTNHPAYGGSHLPDVTVVTPVFASSADVTGGGAAGDGAGRPGGAAGAEGPAPTLIGYVASRAHHAEIGGARPGSMPPAATTLVEEGVVIPPLHLVRGGVPLWDDIRRLLEGGRYPSRAVEDNLADLRAAVAANHAGAAALEALAREHGIATIARYMEALEGLAEARVREALAALPPGRHEAQEMLDDGSPLRVAVTLEGERAAVDFNGTSGVHPGNLNATPAVVRSVVMYVLRLLLKQPLPLNEGLLRAVSLVIPRGILDPGFHTDPAQAPAIVGGNIETSQRLVDTLLKALGLAACSQGTMNNVLFGDASFGYYETICGGAGAGPGFHGAAAVHSHMTNTRITDPEILEHRYPVRVDRFAIRRGSGGAGRWRGGDGAVRELTFLAPVSLSVLSQHRTVSPYGLEGGSPGAPGRQRVVRASGETVALASIDSCEMGPGDRFLLETPGGGGYGTPEPAR
jgi:5-oxoprolinase (ATP-hydrolysing)